jgi:hypothetical protein
MEPDPAHFAERLVSGISDSRIYAGRAMYIACRRGQAKRRWRPPSVGPTRAIMSRVGTGRSSRRWGGT